MTYKWRRELSIGDNVSAYMTIYNALPKRQSAVLYAMEYGQLIQQCEDHTSPPKISWTVTGYKAMDPHKAVIKALIRKNIVVPNGMSNKEWNMQVALGTAWRRHWKINPDLFDPLMHAICLIRSIEKGLKSGKVFNGSL